MNDLATAFIPSPFQIRVDCEGRAHTLEVIDGLPVPMDHDVTDERAMMAFGGELPPCLQFSWAVARSPFMLAANDSLRTRGGQAAITHDSWRRLRARARRLAGASIPRGMADEKVEAWWPSAWRDGGGHPFETFPGYVRRLGVLRAEKRSARDGMVDARGWVQTFVRSALQVGVRGEAEGPLENFRIEIGAEPSLMAPADGARWKVTLPLRWPATVFLFGLEETDYGVTVAARIEPRRSVLTVLTMQGAPSLRDVEIPTADLLPDLVFEDVVA
jgi:hypothetical protein